jgi:hypothetical protein
VEISAVKWHNRLLEGEEIKKVSTDTGDEYFSLELFLEFYNHFQESFRQVK